jgi:hypothetical protein
MPRGTRATKLGPHVLRTAPGLSEYLQSGPAVAKFVGDWGMARTVPDNTLVVARRDQTHYDAQLQRASGKTPVEAAQQFMGDHVPLYRSDPSSTGRGTMSPSGAPSRRWAGTLSSRSNGCA